MAIRFEDKDGKPAKKQVGDKTYVAEEPAAEPDTAKPAAAKKKAGKGKS